MVIILYKTNENGTTWYYTIDDRQPQLFAEWSFTVHWGTALNSGREKLYQFDNFKAKNKKIKDLIKKKVKENYKMLYGFSRDAKEKEMFEEIQANKKIS